MRQPTTALEGMSAEAETFAACLAAFIDAYRWAQAVTRAYRRSGVAGLSQADALRALRWRPSLNVPASPSVESHDNQRRRRHFQFGFADDRRGRDFSSQ